MDKFSHLSDEELIQEMRQMLPHADYNTCSGQFASRFEEVRIELFIRGYRLHYVDTGLGEGSDDIPVLAVVNLMEIKEAGDAR